ncbi:hypothetical protein [Helicobacter canis]|uniref:Periplasmic protein n=1 Tax=Helicobacter canis NCTC 12740 TaxID=1357399 RepID=V8CFL3_9HELI|nr:hypothetical protein [Helicobacter canis]ETD25805.1 hypothetical protein HMPREF2087_01638 [Helicobacter canis NCTC 12740]
MRIFVLRPFTLSLLIVLVLGAFTASFAEPTQNPQSNVPSPTDLLESFSDSSEPSGEAFIRPDQSAEQILHLQNTTPESTLTSTIYVGQRVPITYRVMFFNNASLNQSSFKEKTTTNAITLENPNQAWQEVELESSAAQKPQKVYEITYLFKIKAQSVKIPAFEVSAIASDGSFIDVVTSDPITLNATDLYQNKSYAGVVGEDVQLGIYKAKPYDEQSNLIAFELIAKRANLEDFKLPDIEKQGIERSSFSPLESKAIFYAVVPKNMQNLLFEYFSTQTNRFEQIRVPIVPVVDGVTTQENLKPKNTYLMYWALFIGGVAISCFVLAFFSKSLRKVFFVLGVAMVLYLLYYLFYTKTATISAQTQIWILPTQNSTLLETTSDSMKIKIIGEHGQYYKIITPKEAIGWIRKEDAS